MTTLKYKPFTGLQIICRVCKKTIHNDNKPKGRCSHPIERQTYKAVFIKPNSGKARATKNLKARDYNEAVKECLDFQREVQSGQIIDTTKPVLFVDCAMMYIDYLENIDVPAHQVKVRTSDYVEATNGFLKQFILYLKHNNYHLDSLRIEHLTPIEVGNYYTHLVDKDQSNYTFNAKIKALRGLFTYLIKIKQYSIENIWKEVRYKPERPTDISITKKDFFNLIDHISPNDSYKGNRNMYRDWLIPIIKLKAYTGVRNEQLVMMRWDMIHYEGKVPTYIKSPDLKANRVNGVDRVEDGTFYYIPIGEELIELLYNLGLSEKMNSVEYIISPETTTRLDMKEKMGRYFSFFWKKMDKSYTRKLKHLRQTYVTTQSIYINRISLQHSNYSITDKHYIDKKAIAINLVKNGFRVFPKDK